MRHTATLWPHLAGTHIFITGGTGFYGKWLLEAINAANDRLGANVRATILSRNPTHFATEAPHLARHPQFEWLVGEPAEFTVPADRFDYLFDFATPSAAEVMHSEIQPGSVGNAAVVEHCLRGTANLIEFARTTGVRRVLYASSGAVYGRQPADIERLPEDFVADPATMTPYGLLKQRSEALWLESGCDCVVARGFAFIGPYLPLTDKFAAGSFLRDALDGGPIRILGDGSPVRSYLYGTDLALGLLTLLLRGRRGIAYNLGSTFAITLGDLAQRVAAGCGGIPVEYLQSPGVASGQLYVPATSRAEGEPGFAVRIPLDEAISRTIAWARRLSG